MGQGVRLIAAGEETAEYLIKKLRETDALASPEKRGSTNFYVTDNAEGFERLASFFMGSDISGRVKITSLEQEKQP